jgi:hypothetical protein
LRVFAAHERLRSRACDASSRDASFPKPAADNFSSMNGFPSGGMSPSMKVIGIGLSFFPRNEEKTF